MAMQNFFPSVTYKWSTIARGFLLGDHNSDHAVSTHTVTTEQTAISRPSLSMTLSWEISTVTVLSLSPTIMAFHFKTIS